MVGSRRLRRRVKRVQRHLKNFLRRPAVHETVEFLLMLGFLYFSFTGIMMVIFRTDSFWRGVTSQSMKHEDDYSWRQYFSDRGIDTSQFPLQGGFERGDLLIIQGVSSFSEIRVGDVVVLDQGGNTIPLVHRVVEIWYENGSPRFMTKGDANSRPLPTEVANRPEQILGKVIFVVPKLGYISLWFQGQ